MNSIFQKIHIAGRTRTITRIIFRFILISNENPNLMKKKKTRKEQEKIEMPFGRIDGKLARLDDMTEQELIQNIKSKLKMVDEKIANLERKMKVKVIKNF
jgi:hypothetical protein